MAASFTSREQLEQLVGATRVVQLYDDNGDGRVDGTDLAALEEAIAEANDFTIAALLKKGWELDALNELSGDRALRRAATQILAELSGQRKPGFFNGDGEAFFDALGRRGREYLKSVATGENRSRMEPVAGANKSLRGALSASDPISVFGRDPTDPNDKYGDGRGF